ncbi:MAG: anthranilate phosphoribosyltransferase [Gammaproteobacteria bacterium]
MDLQTAIRRLAAGEELRRDDMRAVMRIIMRGEASAAQMGAFLTALSIKGESVEEITGAAMIMREMSVTVETRAKDLADSVGTGGDGARLFNISTAAALTAAAAGAVIAKHGNRAATGNCGSADVLEAAGVDITLNAAQAGKCIDACGIGFLFAPVHHAATRHVIGARREIGIRTIFNLLGPLTNPAGARRQLVGVFAAKWLRPLAEVFAELGSCHTLVVCSDDGLDEISIAAGTRVAELRDGRIREYRITPEEFGIAKRAVDGLVVADAANSLAMLRAALGGAPGAAFDMVALNAGATLYAADTCDSLAAGVARAREVLADGAGLAKLEELVRCSREMGRKTATA